MKKILILISSIYCMSASAKPQIPFFFQCDGVGNVEEYRVGINIQTGRAAFFDNDTTSTLKYTSTRLVEVKPPYLISTYSGIDQSDKRSILQLVFNHSSHKISLSSGGKHIGTAQCYIATPWPGL